MFSNNAVTVDKLVEITLRIGNIGDDRGFSPHERQQIRASFELDRETSCRFSMPFTGHFSIGSADLSVFGNVDAIQANNNITTLEIIAYTSDSPKHFRAKTAQVDWAKSEILGHLYLKKHPNENEIILKINWYHRNSLVPTQMTVCQNRETLEQRVMNLVSLYLTWAEPFKTWAKVRNDSLKDTPFPFTPYRNGQREMMAEVYRAAQKGTNTMIEAPTGIGKTMAALFPALKALAGGGNIHRIFYLTARNTGQDVIRSALKILAEKNIRTKSVTITAKESACIRYDAILDCSNCRYSQKYYDRLKDGVHAAFRYDEITRECISRIGSEFFLCPFELSLDIALHADVIIADYNYAFDPRVYLKRFFANLEENYLFLIDEAHNLADRGRSMISATLTYERIQNLIRIIHKRAPDVVQELEKFCEIIETYRKQCLRNPDSSYVEKTIPQGILKPLRNAIRLFDDELSQRENTKNRRQILDIYFEILHFLNMAERFDATYCIIYRCDQLGIQLTLFNIDPSAHLTQHLSFAHSAALFSATLSPASYFRTVFGFSSDIRHVSIPSPFPPENLALFVINKISTRMKERLLTAEEVVGAIASLIRHRVGHYMVFFPSYLYLNQTVTMFKKAYPEIEIIIQKPGMTQKERETFLDHFSLDSSEYRSTLVGFAVLGGIFSEGVDLVGDQLSGAIIVGVGLPGLCQEREQIRRYFGGDHNGFALTYTYPGMIKVLQAAGRVIRTASDRGIVMLIDQRFGTEEYRKLYPPNWNPLCIDNRETLHKAVDTFYDSYTA